MMNAMAHIKEVAVVSLPPMNMSTKTHSKDWIPAGNQTDILKK
jgi:hypothetical protein